MGVMGGAVCSHESAARVDAAGDSSDAKTRTAGAADSSDANGDGQRESTGQRESAERKSKPLEGDGDDDKGLGAANESAAGEPLTAGVTPAAGLGL